MHVTAAVAVADGDHASLPLFGDLAIICLVGQIPEFAHRDTHTS